MKVVFSRETRTDLDEIKRYIARDKPRRAVTFVNERIDAAARIGEAPHASAIVERYARRGVRMKPVGKYLIFYRIEADQVAILHILHGAQDYYAILFPEDGSPDEG